jgi:hypothetical protein
MARRGALTAIQAALAGLSGGAAGYVRQQELQREQDRLKTQEERQKSRDIFDLMQAGFMRPEELTQRQQAVTQQGGEVARQALMSALSPRAGAPMPAVGGQGVGALSEALATAGRPAQRLAYGGQEFVRAEAPQQREERLAGLSEQRGAMARQQELRSRAAEQQADRDFTKERDEARQAFDAIQNRLDREARAGETAMRLMAESGVKRPTEAQERNAVYYNLMSNAQQELEALRDNPEIRPWAITAYLNTPGAQFGRGLLSDAEQQFIRAAQDFTAGILRKETGAAATRGEVAQTLERYIQMGGEQPGSAKAKSDARQRVTDAMRVSAMPALEYSRRYEATQPAPSPTAAPATRPPLSSFRRP